MRLQSRFLFKIEGRKTAPMATPTKILKKQLPMQRVLYAVAPIALSSIYFFGWRALLVLAVCNAAGFLTELAFARVYKEPATQAVFVTSTLLALSLPPALPIWMVIAGVVFAVVFGKMVFGGFGRNIFNPALTGRAFLYISFGAHMTGMWSDPVPGGIGGFGAYAPDAITGATPGMLMKTGKTFDLLPLLLGNTSGTLGGTSAILALLGGLYLVRTRAANYRIPVAAFAAFFVVQTLLWVSGTGGGVDPLRAVLAGNAVFGFFFFATDPVSACKTNEGRWFYGAFIGAMTVLIASFSMWPAGTMFAILLANMFAGITDYTVKALKKKRTAKK